MVYRIYVEKKPGFDGEAQSLRNELVSLLGIKELNGLRLLNRYDVEGIDEALFEQCVPTVFSEPPVDNTYAELPISDGVSFAVEYLPGQFDQRADSAAECIQLISQGDRPLVRSARVYLLEGTLTDEQVAEIKKYVINPVEAREASLDTRATLKMKYPVPTEVEVLDGFNELNEAGLKKFIDEKGLAMDLGDIKFCQEYFRSEKRDPTITEIKMIDTYWSDHCRHTTFGTILDDVQIDDAVVQEAFDRYMAMRADLGRENKPRCMMDLATIGAKELKKQGILKNLDESEEINACTVKIKCDVNGKDEDWLFLFKNETHNHPTEIEPFGGAATCIGGAIRDPLSGRSYVYQAMRVTGAGDPLKPVSETLPGKLPQRKLVTTAAAGYSSYGNQIGLATGQVDEIYHPGYVAKRMEIGAVVGATPASHVRREFGRTETLHDKGVVSDEEFEQGRTDLQKAEEELQNAKENLEIVKNGITSRYKELSNTQIRSTIDGMILDVPIKVGNSVIQANTFNDGTTIASVADMSNMLFRGNVDETDVGKLHEGMPVKLTIGALQNVELDANLEYVSPKATEDNGVIMFEVKAAVKIPADVFVRAGYSANASIVIESREGVLTLPESTVEFEGEKTYVYLLTSAEDIAEQTFDKREVKIGLSDGINIELTEGVTADDKVRGAKEDKKK